MDGGVENEGWNEDGSAEMPYQNMGRMNQGQYVNWTASPGGMHDRGHMMNWETYQGKESQWEGCHGGETGWKKRGTTEYQRQQTQQEIEMPWHHQTWSRLVERNDVPTESASQAGWQSAKDTNKSDGYGPPDQQWMTALKQQDAGRKEARQEQWKEQPMNWSLTSTQQPKQREWQWEMAGDRAKETYWSDVPKGNQK